MRQARWTEAGIDIAEVEPPPLAEGWVRLRVEACGICGSDLHLYRRELPPLPGSVPGHEVVGVPVDGPAGLEDRLYAVEPRTWCGICADCASGRRNLCPEGLLLGLQAPGGLGDFMDVPRLSVHPVDRSIPARVASVAEPLAVCARALNLGDPQGGSRVLVLGGGSIGLLAGLLARDRSAWVGITVRHPHQREAAQKLGLEPLAEGEPDTWARDVQPDVVVETVGGRADTLAQAIRVCRAGGRIVVLGIFSSDTPVSGTLLMAKELTILGSNTYGTDRRGPEFRGAVDLLPRFRDELSGLQTHHFPLDSVEDAFRTASDKKSGAIKVTVIP
jgi:threonine dehydrogenase-like Zn-dependent dehydrogenase